MLSKGYQNGVKGIQLLDGIFAGHHTRPDRNRTIYDDTIPHSQYLAPDEFYYFQSYKKHFRAGNFNVAKT